MRIAPLAFLASACSGLVVPIEDHHYTPVHGDPPYVRLAAPPFTNEELAHAMPDARTLTYRLVQQGTAKQVSFRYTDADVRGVSVSENGGASHRQTWSEVVASSTFADDRTEIAPAPVEVETPAGRFSCKEYRVRGVEDGVQTLATYDFALDRPGPAVRVRVQRANEVVVDMALMP